MTDWNPWPYEPPPQSRGLFQILQPQVDYDPERYRVDPMAAVRYMRERLFCDSCQLPMAFCQHGLALRWAPNQSEQAFWEWLLEIVRDGAAREVGPLFGARYGGRCCACGGRWEPGDFIAWCGDEDRYICADCAA